MFDVGFSELCMVGLVSLLVIGPEKLPQVARIVGFWLGKSRRMLAAVKAEIHQELQAEEMRRLLQEQTKLYKNFETEAMSLQDEVLNELQQAQASLSHNTDLAASKVSVLANSSVEPAQVLPSVPASDSMHGK